MKKEYTKLPSEILNSRPELVETRIGLAKGVIGGIPYIGTMINEILFDITNRIQQERINRTVEILKNKINVLEKQEFVLKEYLESDNFFDFTRVLFETAIKIKSEEMRNLLAGIYIDAIETRADFETSKNRLFIHFINDLSIVHLFILKYIRQNARLLSEINEYDKFFNLFKKNDNVPHLNNYEFKSYCNDLELKGLISLGAGLEDYKDKSVYLTTEDHKGSSVIITKFGNEFIDFITK